ncbi:MAG: FAD-dependent monooxygenase [Deltaproteobacteria bacterium]|nr:FAD-dependent monooxygenase [Deltaproteobacteria bacterium]
MPIRLTDIHLSLSEEESTLLNKAAAVLNIPKEKIKSIKIVKKSLDARKKDRISFVYTFEVEAEEEVEKSFKKEEKAKIKVVEKERPAFFPRLRTELRPVIIGSGPAGLFAAMRLTEYGLRPILIERGKEVEKRVRDVERFWADRVLDPESNVQFGEGGAGTFSDGKLTTRIDDPRISYILKTFVVAGANEEILYQAKPHIGTDRLRGVVINMRKRLISLGCDVRFESKVTDFNVRDGKIESVIINEREEIKTDLLILAIGNSARDTYEALHHSGISLERKPFAIGVRVEHPQMLVDKIQYGRSAGHPKLPPAEYLLTHNMPEIGRSAYSFCMCPGGSVISASSEPGRLVVNGMSLSKRDSPYANSALVVTVRPEDFESFGEGPLAGIGFQRRWEEAAFKAGGGDYNAPAQRVIDFLDSRETLSLGKSSYRPALTPSDIKKCLPSYVVDAMRAALPHFDRKMRGFVSKDAVLIGVETRTSAPVRITRGVDLQSVNTKGLYPCGEGAGYAGGIVSSALDGIKVADTIVGAG